MISIGKTIYDQVEQTEDNKGKWRDLKSLIKVVLDTLEGLKDAPKKECFMDALTRLHKAIVDTMKFLKEFVKLGRFKRFVNAGKHNTMIEEHKIKILEIIPLLTIGFNAASFRDLEEKRKIEKADRDSFMEKQERFLRESQEKNFQQAKEFQDILAKQVAASKEDLHNDYHPSEAKEKPPLPEEFLVKVYDVEFKEKLKESRLGNVHKGIWKNQRVLVKWIDGRHSLECNKTAFTREAQIMSNLKHNNIVRFYGACFDEDRMFIVTGDLDPLLNVLPGLDFDQRQIIGKELATGLDYLHSQDTFHSDINPENVGVTNHKEGKWLDLSWIKASSNMSVLDSLRVENAISPWQAPETWGIRENVSSKSDIYSFGWLLWTLFTEKMPFDGVPIAKFCKDIKDGVREDIPAKCPPEISGLITSCWDGDPGERPKITDIIDILDKKYVLPPPPQPSQPPQPPQPPRPPSPTGEEYYEKGKKAQSNKDLTSAFEYYTMAKKKGFSKSYNALGFFAAEGTNGHPKDKKQAAELYTLGANSSHPPAMYNLGRMYYNGDIGDDPDKEEAWFWFKKAHKADPEVPRYRNKFHNVSEELGKHI